MKFKREEKFNNIRFVSQAEIARLLGGGVHTLQSLENFCGSSSVRLKVQSLAKKDLGITREKTSILGNSNQYLYKLERDKIEFDEVYENSAISLGVYYLRESLGLMLSGITPISSVMPAKFRGFLPFGVDSEGKTHYADLRFSFFNEQSVNVHEFVHDDKTVVDVIIFENSRVFNTFQHSVRANELGKDFENQVWIVLDAADADFSSKGTEATIVANKKVVSDRDSFISAFDDDVILTTKDKFYESVEANYKKGLENAEKFKEAMEKGKQRKAAE